MRPSWSVHLSALFYQDDLKSEGSNWKCNNNNVFIAETYKNEINEHTKQHAIFQRIEIIAVFMLIKKAFFSSWSVDDKSKLFIFAREPVTLHSLAVSVSHWLGCRCWKWDAFFCATESVTILFLLPLSSLCVVKGGHIMRNPIFLDLKIKELDAVKINCNFQSLKLPPQWNSNFLKLNCKNDHSELAKQINTSTHDRPHLHVISTDCVIRNLPLSQDHFGEKTQLKSLIPLNTIFYLFYSNFYNSTSDLHCFQELYPLILFHHPQAVQTCMNVFFLWAQKMIFWRMLLTKQIR